MKRLFDHLKYFNLFKAFYLYITYKLGSLKQVPFNLDGFKIRLRPRHSDYKVLNQIFVDQQYSIEKHISQAPIIVDGGANIGISALYFHQLFPSAIIYCIEPEENNFEILKFNTKSVNQIQPLRKALWTSKSVLNLASGISSADYHIDPTKSGGKLVETISISDLLKEYSIPKIDILKLDIEGAEREIFAHPSNEWLSKIGCLMIETHDRYTPGCGKALFNALKDYNYLLEVKGETLKFFNLQKSV